MSIMSIRPALRQAQGPSHPHSEPSLPHSGPDPESPTRHSQPDRESLKTVCRKNATHLHSPRPKNTSSYLAPGCPLYPFTIL